MALAIRLCMLWRKRTLFREVAENVLRSKDLRADETKKAAKRQLTRLIQNFGELVISDLTDEHWTAYLVEERKRRPRKFFDDRKYMRQCVRYAVRKGLIEKPLELQIPDLPWNAGREVLSHELARLEACAGPTLRFQIRIAWKMGLRLREMMRLRWDQVDLERGLLTLGISDTKTRRGRTVGIPPDLLPQFRAWRRRSRARFVFPSRGVDRPQDNNKTAWRRCKAKAQVSARWHDLRHTCATLLLRRGVPIHVVKDLLGMSAKVLTKIYAHSNIDDIRRAAEAMSKSH